MSELIINQIVETIKKNQRFLLTSHIFPDGDSLGSVLAMGTFLEQKLGKKVDMVQDGIVPTHYKFLPNQEKIKKREQLDKEYDVIIVLECPDRERMGNSLQGLNDGFLLINIDHHQDNKMYGDINWLDAKAAAVAELVYKIMKQLDDGPVSKDIAACLYTALLTDTGGFIYSNTRGETLRIAADLLDLGVDAWQIAKQVYHTRALSLTQLMGRMMASIKTAHDGKVAYASIAANAFQEAGCDPSDTEGFITPIRAIAGAEIAILFQEASKDKVKLSIRSAGKFDVAAMAKKLGGGGHSMAAGALVEGDLNSVVDTTIHKVSSWME